MIKQEVIEDNFSKKLAPSYKLSILIGMDSFAYVVTDPRQQILLVKSHELAHSKQLAARKLRNLDTLFQEDEVLGLPYREVRVALAGEQFALLPDRLYNPQEKRTYLNHLSNPTAASAVLADKLVQPPARLIYEAGSAELELLKKHFSKAQFFHLHSALLAGFGPNAATESDQHLYCNIRARHLDLFLFDRTNLQYVNSFTYRSAKDFMYYLLLVFDQFELDQRQTPLYISGQLIEDSEIYRLLSRYLYTIAFLSPLPTFRFGPKLKLQPAYLFYDLLCVAQYQN